MVPVTRGATWSLHDCIYGNEEKEREAVPGFENEMRSHDQLLDIAMGIEGLICGRSIHASAVYVFNEDFIAHNARMKAPNGVLTTQFNMADSDECGGLKMDFLTIEALDKIRLTMEQLIDAGYMEWQGSLRETYDKYLHPDVLDYETREMWDWVAENKVVDLFQFNTQTGLQAARRIQPHSLEELAAANSIMRLMVTEEGAEQPIDTYIRFKNDIGQWYDLMKTKYHLTDHEIEILEKYLKSNYGVGDTQEIVMEISMDKEIADFSVADSNKLRKSIAKKKPALQQAMKEQFFERGKENHASDNLLNYVWKEVVGKQLGYSFSKNHTYPYSAIGLQELNLAYHYPIIYWNTACLTVNAGADEESKGSKQSTDYGKVATSIAQMQKRGIKIQAPLINKAELGFKADEENNAILFALKSISGIGDDVVEIIRQARPFASFEDFYERMVATKLVKTGQMIQLIKAGCFDEFDENRVDLLYTIVRLCKCNLISSLTKSQLNRMQELQFMYPELNLIPDEVLDGIQVYNFSQYVKELKVVKKYIDPSRKMLKCGYHDEIIELDDRAMQFFINHYTEDSIYDVKDEHYLIYKKKFNKETEKKLEPLREYLANPNTLLKYNKALVKDEAKKVVTGTTSHMEMESLCVYVHEHELADLNRDEFNIVNFFNLPEEPVVASTYKRKVKRVENGQEIQEVKEFPKYFISKIWGTVLDKNKDRHTVTLLTPEGVVNVKYTKGAFLHYNKKTSIEESWFKRGQMIMVTGYRNGDMFRCYNYGDTIFKHTTSLITNIGEKGVEVMTERMREA